jgi:cysteine-S-conjugate beta-lyase
MEGPFFELVGTVDGVTSNENPLTQLSLDDLRTRTSMKWRQYPADVLPVWVAEMDVPAPPPVVEAVVEAMRRGDTGYPIGTSYAQALGAFAAERWGWDGVVPELAAIVPDVMMGVVEVLKLITEPGDPVIVNSPVYPPFFMFVGSMQRRIVEAPLGADERIDFEGLEAAFREVARTAERAAYLLCSPHNPTGTVHTPTEPARVAELADAYGVRVVVDEIHAPLVSPGTVFTPYLSVDGAASGFSLMSASKGWNLAGLKAALAIAGTGAAADLARMPEEVSHGPSHIGVIAHVAALREGGPWLDALIEGIDDNKTLLADLLAKHLPAVRWRRHPGTYMAWLDCRALGLGDDPAAAFVERGRVALTGGLGFGSGGQGYARLNLATSPEILEEAIRRMAKAVEA